MLDDDPYRDDPKSIDELGRDIWLWLRVALVVAAVGAVGLVVLVLRAGH